MGQNTEILRIQISNILIFEIETYTNKIYVVYLFSFGKNNKTSFLAIKLKFSLSTSSLFAVVICHGTYWEQHLRARAEQVFVSKYRVYLIYISRLQVFIRSKKDDPLATHNYTSQL